MYLWQACRRCRLSYSGRCWSAARCCSWSPRWGPGWFEFWASRRFEPRWIQFWHTMWDPQACDLSLFDKVRNYFVFNYYSNGLRWKSTRFFNFFIEIINLSLDLSMPAECNESFDLWPSSEGIFFWFKLFFFFQII